MASGLHTKYPSRFLEIFTYYACIMLQCAQHFSLVNEGPTQVFQYNSFGTIHPDRSIREYRSIPNKFDNEGNKGAPV